MSSVRTTRKSTTSTRTTLAQSISQTNPGGRTTRSMAKKFLVLDESLEPSPPTTRSARNSSSGGKGTRTMSVLGSKAMNVQSGRATGVEGSKRKGGVLEVNASKKARRSDEKSNSSLESLRGVDLPSTPNKRPVKAEAALQPTPARVLLSARKNAAEDDDDEDSPEISSRFIARPPTPPRPHINQTFRPASPAGLQATPKKAVEPPKQESTTPVASPRPMQTFAMPSVTPKATATTPTRVMASVSRFGVGTPSVTRQRITPMKTPVAKKPILAALLAAEEAKKVEVKKTEPAVQEEAEEDVTMQEEAEAPVENTLSFSFEAGAVVEPELPVTEDEDDSETAMAADAQPPEDQPMDTAPPEPAASIPAMPPPSRIPRAAMAPIPRPAPAQSIVAKPAASASNKMASLSALGRGAPSGPSDKGPAPRKPSYPSALGAGAPKPRDRLVSGPTMYPQRDGTLSTQKPAPMLPPAVKPSLRSVSEPTRPRTSLSMSTREGLSAETSQSLAGLSDALNKLKMRRPSTSAEPVRPNPRLSASTSSVPVSVPLITVSQTGSTVSRVSSVHRPRVSIAPLAHTGEEPLEEHVGDKSLAAIVSSTCQEKCFKGVVAFVDVRTADGDDASPIFADMLKSLGARVLSRCTDSVTHIIYKSGKPTTLTWWRKQDEDIRPHIVGISWVTRSKEKGRRLDETPYVVEVEKEDIFQKRRKSMEPKALMNSNAARLTVVDQSLTVASARKMSLKYAPKISSPLKKAYHHDE